MSTISHSPLEQIAAPLASVVEPVLGELFVLPPPVSFEFWDGSVVGEPAVGSLRFTNPVALRHLLWSPDQLGLARAYVSGDLEVTGDMAELLRGLRGSLRVGVGTAIRSAPDALAALRRAGAFGVRPPIPPEEMVPHGVRHSLGRDRRAISHHYDVGNRFYELVLGPAMTYSCARFVQPEQSLVDAQEAKHELICRKLGLADTRPRGSTGTTSTPRHRMRVGLDGNSCSDQP